MQIILENSNESGTYFWGLTETRRAGAGTSLRRSRPRRGTQESWPNRGDHTPKITHDNGRVTKLTFFSKSIDREINISEIAMQPEFLS